MTFCVNKNRSRVDGKNYELLKEEWSEMFIKTDTHTLAKTGWCWTSTNCFHLFIVVWESHSLTWPDTDFFFIVMLDNWWIQNCVIFLCFNENTKNSFALLCVDLIVNNARLAFWKLLSKSANNSFYVLVSSSHFRILFRTLNHQYDYTFDWTMLKQRSLQQSGGVLAVTHSGATAGNEESERRNKEKQPSENELKIELN